MKFYFEHSSPLMTLGDPWFGVSWSFWSSFPCRFESLCCGLLISLSWGYYHRSFPPCLTPNPGARSHHHQPAGGNQPNCLISINGTFINFMLLPICIKHRSMLGLQITTLIVLIGTRCVCRNSRHLWSHERQQRRGPDADDGGACQWEVSVTHFHNCKLAATHFPSAAFCCCCKQKTA